MRPENPKFKTQKAIDGAARKAEQADAKEMARLTAIHNENMRIKDPETLKWMSKQVCVFSFCYLCISKIRIPNVWTNSINARKRELYRKMIFNVIQS